MAGVIDSDHQEKANKQYSVTQWGMENMCGNSMLPLGHMLVLPCPMVTVRRQVQQPQSEKGIIIRSSVSSEMRV